MPVKKRTSKSVRTISADQRKLYREHARLGIEGRQLITPQQRFHQGVVIDRTKPRPITDRTYRSMDGYLYQNKEQGYAIGRTSTPRQFRQRTRAKKVRPNKRK